MSRYIQFKSEQIGENRWRVSKLVRNNGVVTMIPIKIFRNGEDAKKFRKLLEEGRISNVT